MKAQMKFQKILTLASLIIAALTIVYAFTFCTGDIAELYYYTSGRTYSSVNANDTYDLAQTINTVYIVLSIIFILLVVTLYITNSNKRRNYYITNYISVSATAIFAAIFAIVGFITVTLVMVSFLTDVNWSATDGMEYWHTFSVDGGATIYYDHYSKNCVMFILGYILFAVVLVDALALGYNLLWKIKLMKGEKELLEQGFEKEVA